MSINGLGLNSINVNEGLNRRAAILAALPPFMPTGIGGKGPQHVPSVVVAQAAVRRDDHVDVDTLEFSHIEVAIEMFGERFSQTLERGDESLIPIVNVHNLTIRHSVDESVNISDLTLRVLP